MCHRYEHLPLNLLRGVVNLGRCTSSYGHCVMGMWVVVCNVMNLIFAHFDSLKASKYPISRTRESPFVFAFCWHFLSLKFHSFTCLLHFINVDVYCGCVDGYLC
jgi:hypothetical protein